MTFTLTGRFLENVPLGAVGFLSSLNDNPTQTLNTTNEAFRLTMISKTDTQMVFRHENVHTFNYPLYLGCIATQNGELLWVNRTKPLP